MNIDKTAIQRIIVLNFGDVDFNFYFFVEMANDDWYWQSTGSVYAGQNYNQAVIPRIKGTTYVALRWRGQSSGGGTSLGCSFEVRGQAA